MRLNGVVSVASGCPDAALGAQLRGLTAMRTTADASALTPLSTVVARVLQSYPDDYNRSAAQHRTCLALVGAFEERACPCSACSTTRRAAGRPGGRPGRWSTRRRTVHGP